MSFGIRYFPLVREDRLGPHRAILYDTSITQFRIYQVIGPASSPIRFRSKAGSAYKEAVAMLNKRWKQLTPVVQLEVKDPEGAAIAMLGSIDATDPLESFASACANLSRYAPIWGEPVREIPEWDRYKRKLDQASVRAHEDPESWIEPVRWAW